MATNTRDGFARSDNDQHVPRNTDDNRSPWRRDTKTHALSGAGNNLEFAGSLNEEDADEQMLANRQQWSTAYGSDYGRKRIIMRDKRLKSLWFNIRVGRAID